MFRWTLTNDDTGAKEVLKTDPHGWKELALEHSRSERYDGIFLDFSLELSFHCKGGGKEFLDAIYDAKGSEGNVTILVEFKTNNTFKRLFEGRVNFASYKEEFKGKTLHTILDIEKKGITQVVLSRDETDVDLVAEESIGGVTLNPYTYAPYTLHSHSKTIKLISKYNGVADSDSKGCFGLSFNGISRLVNNPGLNLVSADLQKTNEIIDVWSTSAAGYEERINTAGQPYSYPISVNVTWNFSGRWRMAFEAPAPGQDPCLNGYGSGTPQSTSMDMLSDLNLSLYKLSADLDFSTVQGNGWVLASIPERSYVQSSITENFSGSGGITITLDNANEKLWLVWWTSALFSVSGETGAFIWFEYDNAEITFDANTNSPSTDIKVVAIHEAWSRVCEGITDQTLAFKSEFFGRKNSQGLSYAANGYGGFTALTDGLRIRGFHQDYGAVLSNGEVKKGIITNMKDMYDSCNAIWGIGLAVEKLPDTTEVVRVEEKDYFYQNTEIYKISNIPNLEMSFAEDMAYSEVHIGYEKWKIEAKGGLDEPNTIARWVFPKIKNIKNTKVLVSPYVAGMYAIEQTRRENIIFNTTGDSDYDDDIFIIALNRNVNAGGVPDLLDYAERGWMLGSGIFDNILVNPNTLLAPDTAYNLRFNLFSNFDRTMNQFTNGLTKDSPQQINYSYLEGNGQMEFQVVGFQTPDTHPGNLNNLVSQNVQNTELPNGRHQRQYPILLPEIYTFTYDIPFSDYLSILQNPYGYISFSESSKKHKKGYIKSLSYTIATQMAEISLIRKFE